MHKKCTPLQIMFYQMAIKLHKLINEHDNKLSFEHMTVINQSICTGRQANFQILRSCNGKIRFNTTANKLYPLSNVIGLVRWLPLSHAIPLKWAVERRPFN